jgi:hypothetical protein
MVLQEAIELVGGDWEMCLIHKSRWLGERELWLIAREPLSKKPLGEAGVFKFFPVLVPRKPWRGPSLLAHLLKAATAALSEGDTKALLKCTGLVSEYVKAERGSDALTGAVSVKRPATSSATSADSLSGSVLEGTIRFALLYLNGVGEDQGSVRAAWEFLARPVGGLQRCPLDELAASGSSGSALAAILLDIGRRLLPQGASAA